MFDKIEFMWAIYNELDAYKPEQILIKEYELIHKPELIKTREFESYIVSNLDLYLGQFRLLDVTSKLILPRSTHIRVLVTSSDVLHS